MAWKITDLQQNWRELVEKWEKEATVLESKAHGLAEEARSEAKKVMGEVREVRKKLFALLDNLEDVGEQAVAKIQEKGEPLIQKTGRALEELGRKIRSAAEKDEHRD